MNTAIKLDPLISEFETQEQEDHYNDWLRKKIQAAMDDTRPNVSHDKVMASMRELLKEKQKAYNAR